MNEGSRIESSSKKRRVKQRSTNSFARRKPLHTVDRSHCFGPNSLFYSGGLRSLHNNNIHQTGQSISTRNPVNRNTLAVEKQDIVERTVNH